MIVVISDLHLQHTKHDVIRRNENGRVLETRVVRNVNAGALSLLFAEITENVERSGATDVQLVLAGDIFELHRTPLWFSNGETRRPTVHPGAESLELEAKVHEILSAIELDNQDFFDTLREFVKRGIGGHAGARPAIVVTHYIPGNHDRLCQLWPSTRQRVRRLLCLGTGLVPADAPFPHQLEWKRAAGYGVRIRHGHEYDPANFSEPFDPKRPSASLAYDKPTFGDCATVEVATRLALAFRVFYARELRVPGVPGEPYRRIYAALTEFDDVRPQSMIVRYLIDYVGASERRTFEILRPVLRDVVESVQHDPFFMAQVAGLASGLLSPVAELIKLFMNSGSAHHMAQLVSVLEVAMSHSETGRPSRTAQAELDLDSGDVYLVIAGHTHQPDHVALPGQRKLGAPGGEAYFLDTGTWRTRLDAGEGGTFGRLRGYTMVFCYQDSELASGDRRRFETWTGHLMAEDFGPMFSVDITDSVRPESSFPVKQRVHFSECRIERIDEGDSRNGAELTLFFGVDHVSLHSEQRGVRNGQVVPLGSTLTVDPALDGELWCHAIERDLGSYFDPDDAMPWAFMFLPRVSEAPGAPFELGTMTLRAADNRSNSFTLIFEVLSTCANAPLSPDVPSSASDGA